MKVRGTLTFGAAALAVCGAMGMAPPAAQAGPAAASAWTKQAPATYPAPREDASMAYDAATRTVVMFGGDGTNRPLNGTWTWDGTTWTKQAPATSPSARSDASMAYDAATRTVVLFGGHNRNGMLGDTWTWGG
jgi:hypothetical protein